MRVALIAETSLEHMNGVTQSLLQVVAHLHRTGHEALVIAPGAPDAPPTTGEWHGARLVQLPSVGLPSYPQVRLAPASMRRLEPTLADFAPEVVHLASPFVLGWQALRAAERIGAPTVAVYQTDIPGFAQRYRLGAAAAGLAQHVGRLHRRATLTLAPSTAAIDDLATLGVERMRLWARGVDGERFRPERRSEAWRARIAPGGETVIGYVGRLAPEKQVEQLAALGGIPGTRVVVIGDGPERAALERMLPDARFLGFQTGDELAESMAGFDVFVHPGEHETFCQSIQEALASGVPVVAPGRGGPVDLVQSSRTGWLTRPGDADDLRARVMDLVGDPAKRRAFAAAARASVVHRSWSALGDELLQHYRDARVLHATARVPGPSRAAVGVVSSLAQGVISAQPVVDAIRPARFVAMGDSLTEGLCDTSRQRTGEYRGWADRLAMMLAQTGDGPDPLGYANLAVRSRTVRDVVQQQVPRALDLQADLVSVFIGGNDLARAGVRPDRLATRLAAGLRRLRGADAEVLLVTPVVPPWPFLGALHTRSLRFAAELRRIADDTGCRLLDLTEAPEFLEPRVWADDRVHLSSHGHRLLSYRAAAVLGVPGARELGTLDALMHEEESEPGGPPLTMPAWLWTHARPWAARRLQGRTAGDGLGPKHHELVPIARRGDAQPSPAPRQA